MSCPYSIVFSALLQCFPQQCQLSSKQTNELEYLQISPISNQPLIIVFFCWAPHYHFINCILKFFGVINQIIFSPTLQKNLPILSRFNIPIQKCPQAVLPSQFLRKLEDIQFHQTHSIRKLIFFFDSINRKQQIMNTEEPLVELITGHPETGSVLQEGVFTYLEQSEAVQKARCYLYDNCIIIKLRRAGKEQTLRIKFTFDVVFELLREEDEKKKIGKPFGLKFEKFQSSITLRDNKDEEQLLAWRDELAVRINQRGFHELFKPIKKIGKGNFASVYLVIKHEDDKKYAVKAFSKEGTYSEQFGKQSLINEIQIMRQFAHKNLMRLYEVYESQNSIYISVELLEGGQLYDKIKSKHKFTPKEIKVVMKGILEGLEVMHARNIMHRDLKPENILLRKQGDFDCVIADFGLSQKANEDYMFVRCGTPGYVAPEVVNLKDLKAKYQPICDLFSVGVIFHLLALRKSPFPGREYDEVLSQNRACKFNFETSEYQSLPETWLNLMKRLLEKDPAKRITATEALNHDFFSKDEMFKEFTEYRKSHLSEECNSPLMLTKNKERKNKGLVRDDSCLKFKMKENIMTGRTDESGETIEQIDSPAAIKQKVVKVNESRFKRLNYHE